MCGFLKKVSHVKLYALRIGHNYDPLVNEEQPQLGVNFTFKRNNLKIK